MGPHSQQNGTAIQRNWSSYLHKCQCLESRNLEAEVRQIIYIYAAVTDWCYQFGVTNEEKEQVAILVLSMYNDIVWREKEKKELCTVSSMTVVGSAKRFPQGHWSIFGLGSEKAWHGSNTYKPNGEWDDVAEHMLLNSRGTSALERGRRWEIVFSLLF